MSKDVDKAQLKYIQDGQIAFVGFHLPRKTYVEKVNNVFLLYEWKDSSKVFYHWTTDVQDVLDRAYNLEGN